MIDYINIFPVAKDEKSKARMAKYAKELQALAKKHKTKFLVVDSELVSKGLFGLKEI